MRKFFTVSESWRHRWPALLLAAASGGVAAHHSFSSIYDSAQTATLTGTVREFLFMHPHPFLVVDVRGEDGEPQRWRAEMDNRFELEDIGMTRGTFRPGDRVIISGSPGRSQPFALYLLQLERPADRLRYRQIGSTPILDSVPSQ
jgi:hypothetical protein